MIIDKNQSTNHPRKKKELKKKKKNKTIVVSSNFNLAQRTSKLQRLGAREHVNPAHCLFCGNATLLNCLDSPLIPSLSSLRFSFNLTLQNQPLLLSVKFYNVRFYFYII